MRINKSLIAYTPTTGAGSGTVTSVALTAPTGFTVTGSPITSSGTLAIAFTTGYGIPPLMTGNSGKFLTTNGTTMSWVNIAGTDVTGAALTEVDDTNVTMTLGGTPSTALLRSVSMTLGWAGQLAVSRGGTGAATLTGVVIGNGTSAMTAVTGGPNQILRVNGTATGYEFYTATFLTNPMTLNFDMIYQSGGVPARLPGNITTTKQYLTSIGNGTATTSLGWASFTNSDVPGDALTKVDDTNVTLTLGGTPSTAVLRATSMTLGWTGQLAVGRGGTGASTLTGVLIGNGTSAVTAVVGTAGQFLRRNLANTAYEFRTLQGGDIAGSELTKTDDTNVTLSLGGTPASALLQPVSLSLGWSGQLSVSRGGTGASTLTGVLIGNGTSAITGVTGTSGQLLRRNVANTAYEFFTASLISGNGVADRVAKWTSATNLIDGQIVDNGTNVSIGTATPQSKLTVYDAGNLFSGSFGGGSTTPNVVALGTTSSVPTINGYNYDFTTHQPLILQSTGQSVGIGVSPSYKLQIAPTTVYSALNTGDGFAIYNPSLSGANLILGVNGSGTSQGALIQGRSGTASTFAIQLQPYGGNVGISINPSHKLDVNGNIGLAGKIFAGFGGVFHAIYDQSANQAITIGDSSNPNTFYAQTNHVFTDRPGTTTFGTFSSAGLVLSTGRLQIPSANYLTYGGAYGVNIPSITGTSGTGAFLSFHPSGSSSGEKMRLSDSGQLRLNGYTSLSSFTGIVQGYLAFTSGGNIITTATPGGVSGTQNYLAKFDSTGIAVGNSRIVDDGTNFLLNGATSVVTGLNLVGSISATDSGGGVAILRRSAVPASGDSLGIIDAWGITTGSTYVWGGGIEIRASQAWNSTSAGTEIAIATTPDNTTSATDMFVFLNNGAVRFFGRTSNPIGAAAGTMYYNSSANNMRYYNGTSWITF